MKSVSNEKPRPFFYLEWIGLNAITIVAAWYISWAVISLIEIVLGSSIQVGGQTRITEDFLLLYVLFPIIGLLTGIIQFTLLRRYLPRMAGWITATLLGWLLPFIVGYLITSFLAVGNSTLWIMLGMSLIGTIIALPQWWILRQRVQHASRWILANGLGWGIIGMLNLVTSEPLPVLLALALVPAIATGIVCWRILNLLPKHELESSILIQ